MKYLPKPAVAILILAVLACAHFQVPSAQSIRYRAIDVISTARAEWVEHEVLNATDTERLEELRGMQKNWEELFNQWYLAERAGNITDARKFCYLIFKVVTDMYEEEESFRGFLKETKGCPVLEALDLIPQGACIILV